MLWKLYVATKRDRRTYDARIITSYYNLYDVILLNFNLYDTDMIQLYHHMLISCHL